MSLGVGACAKAPDPAAVKADAVRRGDEHFEAERFVEAARAYQEAVRADPRDGLVRFKLAKAYRRNENWTAASNETIRAADLLPDDPEAQVLSIMAMLEVGRYVDALAKASARLESHPHPSLFVAYGNARARMPRSSYGIERLEGAPLSGPDYEAILQDIRSKPLAADDQAAENSFRRAIRLAPNFRDAHLALASLLWATRRHDAGAAPLKLAADLDPHDVLINRALGRYYAERERDDEALHYLTIAAAGRDRTSELVLADFYVSRNRISEALAIWDRISAADPSSNLALRAAELELSRGRTDEAMRRIDRILALPKPPARAFLLKAEHVYTAGDMATALRLARAAVEGDPKSGEARLAFARALSATGDTRNAITQYVEAWQFNPSSVEEPREIARLSLALGRYPSAVKHATQAALIAPTDDSLATLAARAFVANREWTMARRTLDPLLTRRPAAAELQTLSGAIYGGRGEVANARDAYERALRADPASTEALEGLVRLEITAREPARARQVLARWPSSARQARGFLLSSARVLAAEGKYAEAKSQLQQLLSRNADDVPAVVELAGILTLERRYADAEALLEQAFRRQSDSLDLDVAVADVLTASGRQTEARARYEQIVLRHADSGHPPAKLARLYVDQGQNLDTALRLATTAKQLLPYDSFVNDTLGLIYVRKDFAALALPHLRDAVQDAPATAEYWYHLGLANERLQRRAEARDAFTRAVNLSQNFPGVEDARAGLGRVR